MLVHDIEMLCCTYEMKHFCLSCDQVPAAPLIGQNAATWRSSQMNAEWVTCSS